MADPTPNPFPLDIGQKQDSWEKLMLLANIDPSFKLDAEEFNKMLQALQFLYEYMTGSSPGTFTPAWENIYFGAEAFINTEGSSTTSIEWQDHVNDIGFTVTSGKLIIAQIFVKRVISGQSYMVRERYRFKKNNISGTWGTDSTNGPIVFSDFIYTSSDIISPAPNTLQVIDLGDIGSTAIHTYINNLDPSTVDWESLTSGNTYYFSCIIDGVEQIYQYTGSLPVEVGSGNTPVLVTDFDVIFTEAGGVQASTSSKLQRFTDVEAGTEFILSDNPVDVSIPNLNRKPMAYVEDYTLIQHTPTQKKIVFENTVPDGSYFEVIKFY